MRYWKFKFPVLITKETNMHISISGNFFVINICLVMTESKEWLVHPINNYAIILGVVCHINPKNMTIALRLNY